MAKVKEKEVLNPNKAHNDKIIAQMQEEGLIPKDSKLKVYYGKVHTEEESQAFMLEQASLADELDNKHAEDKAKLQDAFAEKHKMDVEEMRQAFG